MKVFPESVSRFLGTSLDTVPLLEEDDRVKLIGRNTRVIIEGKIIRLAPSAPLIGVGHQIQVDRWVESLSYTEHQRLPEVQKISFGVGGIVVSTRNCSYDLQLPPHIVLPLPAAARFTKALSSVAGLFSRNGHAQNKSGE